MAEILIIDDEVQLRRVINRILTGMGHTVHEAANGAEGLEVFQQVKPALVITDIVMPDSEGIETIQELLRLAPTVPIVAISGGSAHALYLRAAMALGAVATLEKPFHADQLTKIVADLLGSAGKG